MGDRLTDWVECTSGGRHAERPRVVIWGGKRYPVISVESEWRTPQGRFHRVTTDGGFFELYHDEALDEWRVTPLAR